MIRFSISDDDTHETLADGLTEAQAVEWLRGHCHPYTLYVTAWERSFEGMAAWDIAGQLNGEEFLHDPADILEAA